MAIKDCDNLRAAIERFIADYQQMDAAVSQTEKELAALTAAHAPADVIVPVQDRLTEQVAELNTIIAEGQASVDDFHAECPGEHLPAIPWTSGARSRSH